MAIDVKEQSTGAENIVWDLSDLYAGLDDPAIETDIGQVNERAEMFAVTYRGKVTTLDSEGLYEAIAEFESITEMAYKLGSFAQLLWSTDTGNAQYGALMQRIREWGSQLQQQLVFFELEWTNAPDDFAQSMMQHPVLGHYKHWLETTRRYQPHRLSEPEEKILTEKSVTGRGAWTRFFSEYTGNLRFLFDGEELTQQEILSKLYVPDRDVRQRAATTFTDRLKENLPVLTHWPPTRPLMTACAVSLPGYRPAIWITK
jgi:oligoendopeptidase F